MWVIYFQISQPIGYFLSFDSHVAWRPAYAYVPDTHCLPAAKKSPLRGSGCITAQASYDRCCQYTSRVAFEVWGRSAPGGGPSRLPVPLRRERGIWRSASSELSSEAFCSSVWHNRGLCLCIHNYIIFKNCAIITYDHRTLKTSSPVSSAISRGPVFGI